MENHPWKKDTVGRITHTAVLYHIQVCIQDGTKPHIRSQVIDLSLVLALSVVYLIGPRQVPVFFHSSKGTLSASDILGEGFSLVLFFCASLEPSN